MFTDQYCCSDVHRAECRHTIICSAPLVPGPQYLQTWDNQQFGKKVVITPILSISTPSSWMKEQFCKHCIICIIHSTDLWLALCCLTLPLEESGGIVTMWWQYNERSHRGKDWQSHRNRNHASSNHRQWTSVVAIWKAVIKMSTIMDMAIKSSMTWRQMFILILNFSERQLGRLWMWVRLRIWK